MTGRFSDFATLEFPPTEDAGLPRGGCIYVLFWASGSTTQPFYVGQTNRLAGRMADYDAASFDAPTDFRVGEAVRYLRKVKRCRIVVRYKRSSNPPKEEHLLIRDLQLEGVRLLNNFTGYNYRKADKKREKADLRKFCDLLLGSHAPASQW